MTAADREFTTAGRLVAAVLRFYLYYHLIGSCDYKYKRFLLS